MFCSFRCSALFSEKARGSFRQCREFSAFSNFYSFFLIHMPIHTVYSSPASFPGSLLLYFPSFSCPQLSVSKVTLQAAHLSSSVSHFPALLPVRFASCPPHYTTEVLFSLQCYQLVQKERELLQVVCSFSLVGEYVVCRHTVMCKRGRR